AVDPENSGAPADASPPPRRSFVLTAGRAGGRTHHSRGDSQRAWLKKRSAAAGTELPDLRAQCSERRRLQPLDPAAPGPQPPGSNLAATELFEALRFARSSSYKESTGPAEVSFTQRFVFMESSHHFYDFFMPLRLAWNRRKPLWTRNLTL